MPVASENLPIPVTSLPSDRRKTGKGGTRANNAEHLNGRPGYRLPPPFFPGLNRLNCKFQVRQTTSADRFECHFTGTGLTRNLMCWKMRNPPIRMNFQEPPEWLRPVAPGRSRGNGSLFTCT